MVKKKEVKKDKDLVNFEKTIKSITPKNVKATLPSYNATKAIKSIVDTTNPQVVGGENRFKRTGYFTDEFVEQRTKDLNWLGGD